MQVGDMNTSALFHPSGKRSIINALSGYYLLPSEKNQTIFAEQYCSTVEKWPAVGSVAVIDDLAIVCLDKL